MNIVDLYNIHFFMDCNNVDSSDCMEVDIKRLFLYFFISNIRFGCVKKPEETFLCFIDCY